jgi:ADP-heptose:LPS heptosyltransferase
VQRILVIRFSSIGDIVLTSPVVRVLRKHFPQADIRYVTKVQYAELVAPNPYLNGVFVLGKSLNGLARELRAFNPDVVIDLHHNLRTLTLKTLVGGRWFAFQKLNAEKWMRVNLKLNKLPDIHIVDRYLRTLQPLGVKADNEGLDFFFPRGFKEPVLPKGFEGPYVAVVIGAKFKTKQLPLEKLVELCNGSPKPIVLIGGEEDRDLGQQVASRAKATIWNACGHLTLAESAWMVKQADAVVTNDTGMMHIAAAFNKRIVSAWGNTIPEFGMYPYLPKGGDSLIAEVDGLNCRPCSKIGFNKCPKGHFRCMRDQNIDTIKNYIFP